MSPPADATQPAREPRSGSGLGGLVKHSFVYSLPLVFARFAGLLITPYLLSQLARGEFGVANGFGDLWLAALAQLFGVNLLVNAMSRFYFEQRDARDQAAVVSSCTLVLGIVSWAVVLVLLLFRDELAPILLGSADQNLSRDDLRSFLTLLLLTVPFKLSTMAGLTYLQILQRSRLYSGIQIAKMCLEIGLKVWTIGPLDLGPQGFLASVLAGEALTSLVLTGWMLTRLGARIDWAVFAPLLRYAAPLIPVGLCQVALHSLDRRFVVLLSPDGQDANGVYTAGYLFGMLVNGLVFTPFMQIWQPWVFGIQDRERRAELVARVSTYAVLAVGSATLGFALAGRELVGLILWIARVLFGGGDDGGGELSEYMRAYLVIPWVAAGYVFWALYVVSQMPLYIAKRTWPVLSINLIAVAANVGLNFALIPRFDFVGAAMATLLTFALLAVLGMIASRRAAHVPFQLGRLTLVLASVLAAGILGYVLDTELRDARAWSVAALVATKAALLALALPLLWRSVLSSPERERCADWVRDRLGRPRRADPGGRGGPGEPGSGPATGPRG